MSPALAVLLGLALGALAMGVFARIRAERTLARVRDAEARARSAERMAELGAMTGGLAHEIKNPLSSIGLNAQLLAEGVREAELPDVERSRLVRRVESLGRETERLRGILEDFLEYAGELRLAIEPTDLSALTTELVDFFTPQAERAEVRLRADVPEPGTLVVPADSGLLKQSMLNLMLNATQAMEAQAESQSARGRELLLRVGADRGFASLEVVDTGGGMDAATIEKIFHPYFTTRAGGSGLGLPTTRRVIEAHGGSVEVDSEVGRGTRFVLRLPMKHATTSDAPV